MDSVNSNLNKINIVLLVLAVLLTCVSFSLINNTVRLGMYARRFTIHTMSWSRVVGLHTQALPRHAVGIGLLAALLADGVLAGGVYALYTYEPGVMAVITWQVMAITGGSGVPLRTAHHAAVRMGGGKQVPANEGRRPVQNLTG